tara:strand:- start:12634 stop:13482 length:849 start_codon:yes stop_codon:yes gene_type:complete
LFIFKTIFPIFFALLNAALANAEEVYYPSFPPGINKHFTDIIELAIKNSKIEHSFTAKALPYKLPSAQRTFRHFEEKKMDILWSSCDIDFEKKYLPIYFPLAKGVLSYRLALVHKKAMVKVKSVKDLEDLKYLKIGQGIGWPDILVYENHGIKIIQANIPGLIKMLEENRIDMIPLGIGEIKNIKKHFTKSKDIEIYKDLILYYPWPMIFYVHRDNPFLAKVIQSGLNEIKKNTLLEKSFAENFDKGRELLSSSAVKIKLENKKICKMFPKEKSELWIEEIE